MRAIQFLVTLTYPDDGHEYVATAHAAQDIRTVLRAAGYEYPDVGCEPFIERHAQNNEHHAGTWEIADGSCQCECGRCWSLAAGCLCGDCKDAFHDHAARRATSGSIAKETT